MPSGIRRRRAAKQKVTKKNTRRATKKGHSTKVFGNALIADNWDENLTLTQNYKKLGLVSKLQTPSGGTEQSLVEAPIKKKTVQTARIVTDAEGNTKIIYSDDEQSDDSDTASAPANIPQEEQWLFGDVKRSKASNEIVKQLEVQAKLGAKDVRHQSEREQEWLERLVAKHGDDYNAMQWDKKLNKFQQSAGDIKRRVRKLRLGK